jgi:enamine deaminase RidA (YjgF/YER057c/UK114 family)
MWCAPEIYLRNDSDWQAVSAVHARYFANVRPANTLIAGITIIGGYDVEIEVEAEISGAAPVAGD